MTREIVSVTVDSSLAEVVALMEGRRIKRLLDLERSYESLSSIGYLPCKHRTAVRNASVQSCPLQSSTCAVTIGASRF